jgi:hypothetical protein
MRWEASLLYYASGESASYAYPKLAREMLVVW